MKWNTLCCRLGALNCLQYVLDLPDSASQTAESSHTPRCLAYIDAVLHYAWHILSLNVSWVKTWAQQLRMLAALLEAQKPGRVAYCHPFSSSRGSDTLFPLKSEGTHTCVQTCRYTCVHINKKTFKEWIKTSWKTTLLTLNVPLTDHLSPDAWILTLSFWCNVSEVFAVWISLKCASFLALYVFESFCVDSFAEPTDSHCKLNE